MRPRDGYRSRIFISNERAAFFSTESAGTLIGEVVRSEMHWFQSKKTLVKEKTGSRLTSNENKGHLA